MRATVTPISIVIVRCPDGADLEEDGTIFMDRSPEHFSTTALARLLGIAYMI